jgi:hypothetical protein
MNIFYGHNWYTNSCLIILHQSIRGLSDRSDELMCSLISSKCIPHFICLSEHCTTLQNLSTISFDNYYVPSNFSCINHIQGGVCICNGADLQCTICDVSQFCIEKTFEVCVTQLNLGNYYIIIICICRPPAGNFLNFFNHLDSTL